MSTQVSNPYSFNIDENEKHFIGVPASINSIGFSTGDEFEIIPDRKSSSVIGWDTEGYGQIRKISADYAGPYKYHITCVRLLGSSSIFLGVIGGSSDIKFSIQIGNTSIVCNFYSHPSNICYYRGNIRDLGISFEVGVPIVVEVTLYLDIKTI